MQADKRDIVQYYVVNESLSMSEGKIASQVAHAAVTMTLHCLFQESSHHALFQEWLQSGQKKIVLKASEAELIRLTKEGFLSIRDGGKTEVPAGSLTVVALPPMDKEEARSHVPRLKLL